MDSIFLSDPQNFNDPLEAKPYIYNDISIENLKSVLKIIKTNRIEKETTDKLHYFGQNTSLSKNKIQSFVSNKVNNEMSELDYLSSDPPDYDSDASEYESRLLIDSLEAELLNRKIKGIFCASELCDCPLMWSHYADNHRGLCIGYTVPEIEKDNFMKIKYGGERIIKVSTIAEAMSGNHSAQSQMDRSILGVKAERWKYENEWRMLGHPGLQSSPLELSEIIFGLRCDATSKYVIVKSLEGRSRPVSFFEIKNNKKDFELTKEPADISEITSELPRQSLKPHDFFDIIPELEM